MKLITIKVHPSSSVNQITDSINSNIDLEVYTTSPATDNKANLSIIKQLSKHLKIPKSKILISRGEKNKIKIISISY